MEDELVSIFQEIFPSLTRDIILKLEYRDFPAWDSFNHLRLIAKIQSQFGLKLTFGEMKEMNSFKSMLEQIRKKIDCEK